MLERTETERVTPVAGHRAGEEKLAERGEVSMLLVCCDLVQPSLQTGCLDVVQGDDLFRE